MWTHLTDIFIKIILRIAEEELSPEIARRLLWFYDMNGRFGLNGRQEKFFELSAETKDLTKSCDC